MTMRDLGAVARVIFLNMTILLSFGNAVTAARQRKYLPQKSLQIAVKSTPCPV